MPAASGHTGGQGFLVQVEERDDERAAEGRWGHSGVRVGVELSQNGTGREFPGGPVVRALSCHCRGHEFKPCLGS